MAFALCPAVLLIASMGVATIRPPAPAPFPEAPVPVLLVPGWYSEATDLEPLMARLIEAGWPPARVRAINFADPVGSNEAHADEVSAAVEALRRDTGADRIDVVAHSMGGLALRASLARTEGTGVRRVVFLGTPQRGTWVAYLAWGEGGKEMEPDSDFLAELNQGDPIPASISALTIRTPLDTHVVPGGNATLPGALDVEVCCPTHPGLVTDDRAFLFVQTFLAKGAQATAARSTR